MLRALGLQSTGEVGSVCAKEGVSSMKLNGHMCMFFLIRPIAQIMWVCHSLAIIYEHMKVPCTETAHWPIYVL